MGVWICTSRGVSLKCPQERLLSAFTQGSVGGAESVSASHPFQFRSLVGLTEVCVKKNHYRSNSRLPSESWGQLWISLVACVQLSSSKRNKWLSAPGAFFLLGESLLSVLGIAGGEARGTAEGCWSGWCVVSQGDSSCLEISAIRASAASEYASLNSVIRGRGGNLLSVVLTVLITLNSG